MGGMMHTAKADDMMQNGQRQHGFAAFIFAGTVMSIAVLVQHHKEILLQATRLNSWAGALGSTQRSKCNSEQVVGCMVGGAYSG